MKPQKHANKALAVFMVVLATVLVMGEVMQTREAQAELIIETVAGNGINGYSGDGGPATAAELHEPPGVAVDGAGNIYIADKSNYRIRKVDTAGIISTVAGNGSYGYSGDGGPATAAELSKPWGLAVDEAGNIYIVDTDNYRIRKVNTAGIISTVAGNGSEGYSGDGGPATAAQISPWGVAVDGAGNIYISANSRIRKVDTAGIISTVAGNGINGYSGDGGPATAAQISPIGVAVDGAGNIFIVDYNNRIRKVDTAGIISTVAGNGINGYSGDGGPATAAQLNGPVGLAVDGAGKIYIADYGNFRIRQCGIAWYVDGKVASSGDGTSWATAFKTIQEGIAASSSGNTGNTVLVYDGTYIENINFLGKAIRVESVNGASNTIIDGNGSGTVVSFTQGESSVSILDGFTIRNGNGFYGGGIICDRSSPTITNCTITGNSASYYGGGIGCYYTSSPVITNCTITGNSASFIGGGLYCLSSSPVITNCTITGNTADSGGGIGGWSFSSPVITNCTITGNSASYGGGINCEDSSSPVITNCTITGNSASYYGGGIYCWYSSPTVKNSILWGDTAFSSGNEIYLSNATISITYSDVAGGWPGTSNINADPLFVGGGNFHLKPGSPCVNTGAANGAPEYDKDGTKRPQGAGFDMGAYESKDTDNDGLPDTEEQGPDGTNTNYDGNGDGTADNDQANVTSLHTYNGEYVTIATDAGTLRDVSAIANPSTGACGSEQKFPLGFFNIKITGLAPGASSTVTLYVPAGVTVNRYYKYDAANSSCNDFTCQGNPVTPPCAEYDKDRNVFYLHLIDGGVGDDDGEANGTIVDPGAPAADLEPPQITIITPKANVAVQDGVTFQAKATDVSGVDELFFSLREPDGGEGIDIGYDDFAATYSNASGYWEYWFDTTKLQDGYYVIFARATDDAGNEGMSSVVPFSIRNWAVITKLPSTPNSKAGRTMPIKFSLRIAKSVDPAQPFVYNEDLQIRIYRCDNTSCSSKTLMQTSVYGTKPTDYKIDVTTQLYQTNFQTTKTPAQYLVEIWRPTKNFLVGSFAFKTVK